MTTKEIIINNVDCFQSEDTINKLKEDINNCDPKKINTLEDINYLKEGYHMNIKFNKEKYFVNIITTEEHMKEERRKMLRRRLHNAQRGRSTVVKQERDSLKRSIPKKLYKSYEKLMKNHMFANNIPSPADIINNPDKFKDQISQIMGVNGPLSNNPQAHAALRQYFDTMGQFMGFNPTQYNYSQDVNPIQPSQLQEVDTDEEED